MSHELRTPLNVISGYTKLIQEGVMGPVNAEQNKALEKVSHHANELLFMVNSIMHATKIEAGAVAADKDNFWLSGFLDDLKPIYDYPYGKEVALVWDYPADLPLIESDRDKLKHILQNLINNAIKFTDSGTISISAREIDGKNAVEFVVQDTGIGIAAEQLPLIFDRFRQVDSSRTRTYGGVGLGLHIVKTFTELLGGSVSASSQLGKGSTFTVVIPCNDRPRHPISPAVPRQLA
jgi:signal transduction histidine kinase